MVIGGEEEGQGLGTAEEKKCFVDVIISATAELSLYTRVIRCRFFLVLSVSHWCFAVRSY